MTSEQITSMRDKELLLRYTKTLAGPYSSVDPNELNLLAEEILRCMAIAAQGLE